jgi:hypothetical protein
MPKFLIQTGFKDLAAGLDFLQAVEKLTLTKNLILPTFIAPFVQNS